MNANSANRKAKKKKSNMGTEISLSDDEITVLEVTQKTKDHSNKVEQNLESVKHKRHSKKKKSKRKRARESADYEVEELVSQQQCSDEVAPENELKRTKKKKHSHKEKSSHKDVEEEEEFAETISFIDEDANMNENSYELRLLDSLVAAHNISGVETDSLLPEKQATSDFPILHATKAPRKTQLSLSDIKSLRAKGVKIKTGKFSEPEDKLIKKNFRRFRKEYNINKTSAYKVLGINLKSCSPDIIKQVRQFDNGTNFIYKLGKGLEDRTLYSIYRRARLILDPARKNFKSREPLTEEQRKELFRLVELKGRDYSKISTIMNIPAQKLLEEMRKVTKKKINKGHFLEEENEQFIKAMTKVLKVSEDEIYHHFSDIDWEKVASYVPTRTAIQCRKHWTQARIFILTKGERSEKFDESDNVALLELLKQSGVQNEEEIDWGSIAFEFKRKVGYCEIRKKWRELKARVPSEVSKYFDLDDYINYLENAMQSKDD